MDDTRPTSFPPSHPLMVSPSNQGKGITGIDPAQQGKKPWQTPALTVYGTVDDLTRFVSVGINDLMFGSLIP